MRVELRQYFAIAAASPEISSKVSALARERIGGMQGISAQPPKPLLTLFGDRWDPACADMRRFLSRNQITFDWVAPDSPVLATLWQGPLPTKDDCPVLRLADGEVLHRPTARDVARRLGLQTGPRLAEYDAVIIGGGPAGLAAAVYGASEGLRTLCIEREAPGGQAGTSSRIENYLGFPSGVSGEELASRALLQAKRLGARSWSRARSPGSIRGRTRSSSMVTRSSGRGPSSSPRASDGAASRSRGSTASSARASTSGRRAARQARPTV